ncbi:hypothetical protein G7048_00750 [Diaphorobacter sp. HDW4B]|uniref:hypothetical protein n=1 Tax=Diaphorobacter sp. HDW4B TaxID=2714925 RepID=UPI00140D79C2|nr:hypothetical protein [Diaphorobacter sp. HDW4B]QIL69047.1 hypothetical protein G7048_00750 [Diaphorobacter sp. HDW4B]
MKQVTLQRSTLMLGALLALTACGGGGGGNDDPVVTDPPVTTNPPPTTQPPPPPPPPPPAPAPTTQELVQQYYDTVQKVTATSLPAKGEDRYSFFDACALHNGRTKAASASSWDATASGNAYTVGRTFANIQIVAERKTTNADGSARHEVDVTVDTKYTDGTSLIGGAETLIAGSSSGTEGCTAPQTGAEMRFLGNRRKVNVEPISRNRVETYRQLADGTTPTGAFRMRREVAFTISDPANVATYAVVSWGTTTTPYSMKLISPRIARDAPEMQDAAGSGTYSDTGNFRQCRTSSANTEANAAKGDCTSTTIGISGETWGSNITATDAAARATGDTNFDKLALGTGAEVTFAIFADDGWKTVNGQSGKTPIATYKVKIKNASYPFAQMDISAYPQFSTINPDTATIATQFKATGGTATAAIQAAKPPTGGLPMALSSLASFRQGPKTTSASGRYMVRGGKNASFTAGATTATIPFDGKPADASATTYGEFSMTYSDRNSREMFYGLQFSKY